MTYRPNINGKAIDSDVPHAACRVPGLGMCRSLLTCHLLRVRPQGCSSNGSEFGTP